MRAERAAYLFALLAFSNEYVFEYSMLNAVPKYVHAWGMHGPPCLQCLPCTSTDFAMPAAGGSPQGAGVGGWSGCRVSRLALAGGVGATLRSWM